MGEKARQMEVSIFLLIVQKENNYLPGRIILFQRLNDPVRYSYLSRSLHLLQLQFHSHFWQIDNFVGHLFRILAWPTDQYNAATITLIPNLGEGNDLRRVSSDIFLLS